MKPKTIVRSCTLLIIFSATTVFAQAFGEYGRAVGNVPHGRGITGSGPTGGGLSRGNSGSGGVGDVGGSVLPDRLVVIAKGAALFPRQDDESQQIARLVQGESLVPMIQATGRNEWYMVKTQQGLIGWVKSADVREEKVKK